MNLTASSGRGVWRVSKRKSEGIMQVEKDWIEALSSFRRNNRKKRTRV